MDADAYLTIPHDYAEALGGMHWSTCCEAVEFGDGRTLAVVEQLAFVLEGVFAAYPAVPHFAHILHLLKLTVRGGDRPDGPLARLHEAFRATARPGTSRNIGVLFSHLCRGLPSIGAPPKWAGIQLELKRQMLFPEPSEERRAEKPSLGPDEFEHRIAEVLYDFDLAALTHWIRDGCPPSARTGRRLAESLKDPPRRIEPLTAVLRRRPRLAGAVALAPIMDAALAMPPRRQQPNALPQGGYAGVVTRGAPERLLPSQFALDSHDFIRRFAENELLYFRREEPHHGERPARLVVLDQGVRTWGGVRLALAAAVVALIGKDRRRVGPVRLVATSAVQPPVDPSDLASDALADLLEASDLTAHPAAHLAAALADAADPGPRDVILLTHPRNLGDPALQQAAAGRRQADRLFALAVDDDGRAELGEWRVGGIVRLRSFRVDLAGSEAAHSAHESRPAMAVGAWRPWTGNVEPIVYPFRPGLLGVPQGLAFDAGGEWVAVLGPNGLVHAAKLDGSTPEVLPRALVGESLLTAVEAVLGVEGGFVVCGKLVSGPDPFPFDSTGAGQPWPAALSVAAHYDLTRRSVAIHWFRLAGSRVGRWYSFPDLNAVAVANAAGHYAVDLGTGDKFPADRAETHEAARAREAQHRTTLMNPPPPAIRLLGADEAPGRTAPYVKVAGGVVWLGNVQPPWPPFIPTSEGRRLFEDIRVTDRAQFSSATLAVEACTPEKRRLYLFQGPAGRLIAEFALPAGNALFQLSYDGRLLARQTGRHLVEVTGLANGQLSARLSWAEVHNNIVVLRDGGWLGVAIGNAVHLFALDATPIRHRLVRHGTATIESAARPISDLPNSAGYDPKRFRRTVVGGVWALIDLVGGQVILLHPNGRPAAHILVRRGLAAIVLPDGTRWGSTALLGGSETPGAAEKVGQALQEIGRS